MDRYESYNPAIPTEETQPQLPPAPEPENRKTTGRKRKKADKEKPDAAAPRVARPAAKETTDLTLSAIVEKVKTWAGSQTVRLLTGLVLGCLGVYLGISFFSYLADCFRDQSAIASAEIGAARGVANSGGEAGARLSELLINRGYGLGAAVIVFWLLAMSLKELTGKPRFKTVNFTIKCIVAFITISLIVGLATIGLDSTVNWGGWHGRYVNEFVISFFGWTGGAVLCVLMLGVFVIICLRDIINWILRVRRVSAERKARRMEAEEQRRKVEEEIAEMARREAEEAVAAGEAVAEHEETAEEQEDVVTFGGNEAALYEELPDLEEEEVERPDSPTGDDVTTDGEAGENEEEEEEEMVVNVGTVVKADTPRSSGSMKKDYRFPPCEILRPGVEKISIDTTEQLENKEKIRKTLLDFGIPIVSIEATVGPTVTLYEIRPDKGVKIARIRNLVDDIALSLSAIGVRIIAPIPGKGTVGIEVANKDPQTVSMRTVIQSRKYQESRYRLPVALGCTISNDVYITDLAKMPHLLVAGATGQGKSVGLNALIASLLYCRRPDELKFVMIDPKMVEFSLYAKIEKHYLAKIPDADEPIITDMSKVVATLSSLCVEMDDRYQLLKDAQVRNLEEYNAKFKEGRLNPENGHKFLPYIVVIVDEFSDLIMTSGKEVEMPIARLAQKARAVGMHVIIATQRPSTNVITGIIKANFPARIAFKVSSGVDSKTILDTTGAQQLIGRGDMLISNSSEMVRVQCAFIDTPEVEEICDYIAAQPFGEGAYILPEPVSVGEDGEGPIAGNGFGERDPLFDECARVVVMSNTASTSSLQRRYAIGYNRAGKIMDQLEAAGIVGPSQGGKPRAVLVDQVTLESILGG
ncbi:MAG: DNA translocase FtsK [Muribaculaceae bacterium]|nr:DNA translocase FtsK [Muribaculaceae bacterium]